MQTEWDRRSLDMQLIAKFLGFAWKGDSVGLNLMLRAGISPNVQNYDNRTALHLAASEGHSAIVQLLLRYNADVNLKDRWHRTPLADAKHYGHLDICRILEVNGGRDSFYHNQPLMTVGWEKDSEEVDIDISEINILHSSTLNQGIFGTSEKVKWRGTWVVMTRIERRICHPVKMVLSATDNILLRELRHPNIFQFLASIIKGEEMIIITEFLSGGNLDDILARKKRLYLPTALRYALDIARGMNYLHEHKPCPIVHYHLDPRNLLLDAGGHLKINEYWVQKLYERIHPNQDIGQRKDNSGLISKSLNDTKKDIHSFGLIFYQMLEGRHLTDENVDVKHPKSVDCVPKFPLNRYPGRIQQLIEHCCSKDPSERPPFKNIIEILEEASVSFGRKAACPRGKAVCLLVDKCI